MHSAVIKAFQYFRSKLCFPCIQRFTGVGSPCFTARDSARVPAGNTFSAAAFTIHFPIPCRYFRESSSVNANSTIR